MKTNATNSLSPRERAILEAIRNSPRGFMTRYSIYKAIFPASEPGRRTPAERASLSRSLRRLFAANLIELREGCRNTFVLKGRRLTKCNQGGRNVNQRLGQLERIIGRLAGAA